KVDFPSLPVVFRLVALRNVRPDLPRGVDITGPHLADLSRSHPREKLKLDHGPNLTGDMRPHSLNESLGYRLNWFALPCLRAALPEPRDGLQAMIHTGGNKLVLGPPLEDADDLADPFVDLIPAEAGFEHRGADRFQSQRSKVARQGVAIELA